MPYRAEGGSLSPVPSDIHGKIKLVLTRYVKAGFHLKTSEVGVCIWYTTGSSLVGRFGWHLPFDRRKSHNGDGDRNYERGCDLLMELRKKFLRIRLLRGDRFKATAKHSRVKISAVISYLVSVKSQSIVVIFVC